MLSHPLPPLPSEDLDRAFDMLTPTLWRQLSGRRLFVTGGTGFVGKWLLATLLEADRRLGLGVELTVLSRDPVAFAAKCGDLANSSAISWIQGDVRTFRPSLESFDTVIHAATDVAAQNSPLLTFDTCVEGTRRALDFARSSGARDFLLVSSGAVYGRQPPSVERVQESFTGAPDPLLAGSAYGEGKRAAEWLCCAAAADSSLRVKIARCFAFVGPHLPLDGHFAIGNFLKAALERGAIIIRGDGTPYRSYLYAADMAAWLWAVLLRGESAHAYNVGAEESVSIAELAARVCRVLEVDLPIRILKASEPGRAPERYVPDTSVARRKLDLPAALSLDDAIRRTALWHAPTASPQGSAQ